MKVKVKKVDPLAKLPTYATDGSACFDIYTTTTDTVSFHRTKGVVLNTGLAFEIPEGYVLKVYSRSGTAFNFGVRLANCVSIIDSDFRGELKLCLRQDDWNEFALNVQAGDRIAQGEIVPVIRTEFEEVAELSETQRGEGGFGSTGK